ncbi:TonB-dependent receptor [Novosphingobium sp.]|uniref:TonB-dependent receptor plug domain-containing protein n=1 Tax=Novosphingobium sp. TaxID=1874826 RepID=UPI002B46436A|nr:TonB-dependent receptor [Novosphingobium sp.]HKR92360.1 TonB-dependent receptor [Novosphingobium sp.]
MNYLHMNRGSISFRKTIVRLLATIGTTALLTAGDAALAAETTAPEGADQSDLIIVTGTRRTERTATESSVPVDVVSAHDLASSTPSPDLNDKLARLIPSFNVQRLPTFDGASFVRPATLRGLSPDQTLVLVNGKRRHRSAFISTPQRGEQAVDLAQIPQIALSRIEVLRDGASAQYGSDAIAGVINLILEDRVGFDLDAQAGQYYKGDGEGYLAAGRAGLALGDRGVLSVAGEFSSQGETDRGTAVTKIGQPFVQSWKIFVNTKYALSDGVEAYAFGNYNWTKSRAPFLNRDTGNAVYARSFFQDNPPFIFPTWNLTSVYPNGFSPRFGSDSKDTSIVAGLRGEITNNLRWDVSGRYGRNRIGYSLSNSINASLGPQSPTSFNTGSQIQTEYAANADFTWLAEVGLYRPISISFGGEWRRERYQINVGDVAAYAVGPLSDLPPGANGFPSPTPDQAGSWKRDSRAAYVDIDIDLDKRFNLGGALRFENFDDFGSTWNYKFSSRYKLTPWLNLRAAVSTGFHAPTIGQQNLTNTTQNPDPNNPPPAPQVILTNGLIPSTNPIARLAGGKPLVPERATNYSAGFVLMPIEGLTLSADYYHINIRNRLGLTSVLTLTPEQRAVLIAQGVSQAAQLSTFRFFINGYDTRTNGLDVVAVYSTRAGNGQLSLTAAYNYNQSRVSGGDPKIVDGNLVQDIEHRLPHHTANVGADYQIGRVGLSVRGRYYAAFTDALPFFPPQFNQRFGPETFFDASVSYAVTEEVRVTLGAENIFNNYPDSYKGGLSFLGFRYPAFRPYEADGGRYYARVSAHFR